MIKKEDVLHIRNLKQALHHGFLLEKEHRVIKFNQKVWLKSSIDMNTELTKNTKIILRKFFLKLRSNAVFGKTMENVRNQLLAIKMKRTQILINNPVYLGRSISEISKIVMYEFWYDYVKRRYGEKAKLCDIHRYSQHKNRRHL